MSRHAYRVYTSALGIRGDMLYCPLPLYIDSYWTCEPECAFCYSRRLNRTWGNDFRAADPEAIKRRLTNPKDGKTPLQRALYLRKTIRMGNRSDPFQDCELKYGVSTEIVRFLAEQEWDTVIQTKFPRRAWELTHGLADNFILAAEITVGLEQDWELFERRKTEHPFDRIRALFHARNEGIRVGAIGEPFIPGYHTVRQFEETVKLLKQYRINRYNVYNLHFNDLVAKNLAALGLDIERIWYENQDRRWRKTLRQLLDIADKHGIILGCPDFVNSGWHHKQRCNTCCGLDVRNPCTFNTHHFKLAVQEGRDPLECWDGVGNYDEGVGIINGTLKGMYTLKDVAP